MVDVELVIVEELEALAPSGLAERADWQDALDRSGMRSKQSALRPRHTVLGLAVLAAAIVVATALATGVVGRFGAWVDGAPGRPAPAGLQHGFETRNRAAYAAFPAGTKLRLLLSRTVGGTTFSLLGFRNGDAYCLRLVRNDHPDGIGRNECLRAEELSNVPALVVDDVWFSVGRPAQNVNGVYGFADDSVRALRIQRLRGSDDVPVVNNVFLSLRSARAGSVQDHPLPNPVFAIHARLRDGKTENVPYVSSSFRGGVVPGGTLPAGPSYFAFPAHRSIPGPSKVTAPIAHPTIAWLKKQERRGGPMPPTPWAHVAFARVVQPDPDEPVRIGVAVGRRGALCEYYFAPLAPQAGGGGCGPWFRLEPIRLGSWFDSPIEHFNGLVADGVTHVTAFLGSGRIVQAALRDNVFTVAVSATELPARLVGYDAQNRVAGFVKLPGNGVLRPCPTPALAKPVSALPRAQPWQRVDLGSMTVAGQQILGRTPAEVEAALGKPALIRPNAQSSNGVPIPELRYGGVLPASAGLTVGFGKKGDRIFANALYFQSPSLADDRLGHVLRLDPLTLQRKILQVYGRRYRLYLSYGSNPGFGCTATLPSRSGPSGIILGLDPLRPSRPYLILRSNSLG